MMAPMLFKEIHRDKHEREDGWLSELISMKYDDQPFSCLHSYLVSIRRDMSRANHYHIEKEEWIAITSGKIDLLLEDIRTKERAKIHLDTQSKDYKLIYVPPLIAHSLVNVADGESSAVVFSKAPEKTSDTTPYTVET
jgi:dTDP-4-dehydrorhamnose 3,5-epimerase-like enzyme